MVTPNRPLGISEQARDLCVTGRHGDEVRSATVLRGVENVRSSFVHLKEPGDDAYIDLVKTEPKKPIRVTLQSGTNDLMGLGTWFAANNSMAASLGEAGYSYRYLKSTTEHGPTKWHKVDFPDAMRWLWKGYTLPHYAP